jgi:hypothetical protein
MALHDTRRTDVSSYLIVANQTLGGEQLLDEVRRRKTGAASSFYVIVPNTRPADIGGLMLVSTTDEEHHATLRAQSRLDEALHALRAEGVEAEGDLGDPDPMTAIDEALKERHFDEIILSTLPPGVSRWLRMDLPHQVERKFKLPLTTVTAKS